MSGPVECPGDEFPRNLRSRARIVGVTCCVWLIATAVSFPCRLLAADSESSRPIIGWHGQYIVGRWTEISIPVTEPGDYEIRITAPDPEGHRVTFSSKERFEQGSDRLRGLFKTGQLDPEIEIQVASAGRDVASWKLNSPDPLDPSSRLIVTVGKPPGFDWNEKKPAGQKADSTAVPDGYRSIPMSLEELPSVGSAYDSVSLLVIAGRSVLSSSQANAVRDWVASGGHVLISLPSDIPAARAVVQVFAEWLPMTVSEEPAIVSEFGKLEFFAGKNVRIPFKGRLPIPGVKTSQGQNLAPSRDEGLLVRAPYGLGSVTVLAMDLTQPPLSNWTELQSLGRRLAQIYPDAAANAGVPVKNVQLSSTGISDLATQLHAVQEDFAGVNRASPWFVMGLLALFLVAIGPVDYLIVHRLIKRPRGTWITLPIWVIISTLIAVSLAAAWNGKGLAINQLNVVDFDVDSATCHQRMWTNIYSPITQRQSVSVDSKLKPATSDVAISKQLSWSGTPEATFGGMLRPSSLRVGNADYKLPIGASAEGLPLMQWTSKPLQTEIHGTITGLVESNLQSNGVGQLSGTLIHHFPGDIEDWYLVFGNRIYRQKKTREAVTSLPLLANHTFRVDQPNVFPRELRAFLTGRSTIVSGKQSSDASQFVPYDTLSRDPAEILRILTFHSEVGGTKYTGLTNRMLESEDLSHLVRLGRAVLFGRLDSPVTLIQMDGREHQPDREATFVRIVLPVKKIGDAIKLLDKLDQ